MKRTDVEGGRFRNNELMLYFGIALLLGGLASKVTDKLPSPDEILKLISSTDTPGQSTTEVGPRLSK